MLLHRINPEKNEVHSIITGWIWGRVWPVPMPSIGCWGRIGRHRSGFLIRSCASAVEAEALATNFLRPAKRWA